MHVTILYDYDDDEKIYILSSLSLSLSLIMAPWIKISSHTENSHHFVDVDYYARRGKN